MSKAKWALFSLMMLGLFALVPSFSLSEIGRTANTAEAAPASGVTIVNQQCLSADRVRIQIQWQPSNEGVQWVDLTLFNNGFAPGTFIGQGPLAPGTSTFVWDGLIAGLPHFLRVNTLTPNGWQASSTVAFTTISGCTNLPATGLGTLSELCQPDGRVTESFRWNPGSGIVQWFDISAVNDNFTSPFFGFGPLAANLQSLTIPHLEDNTRYYIRVNTFYGGFWAPSQTVSFLTRNCVVDFTTADKTVNGTASGPDQAVLDDVRIASHAAEGYDRIVFEFDGPLPDATIGYESSAVACGSGNTIDVAGSGTLIIHMDATVAHDEMGQVTAPTQVNGTGAAILEARGICDFEAVVEWAIGIDGTRGFRVTTLTNPNRIVIDVIR